MNDLTTRDPSELGFPAGLALEAALGEKPFETICKSYRLNVGEGKRLLADPLFAAAVSRCQEALKSEGMGFKMKAQVQAEACLKRSWELINDPATPANVQADLIKQTWKVAGYDGASAKASEAPHFSINIVL